MAGLVNPNRDNLNDISIPIGYESDIKKRVRNWCFTLNNYTQEELIKIGKWDFDSYLVVGREIGENGTPHLQCYLEMKNGKSFTTLTKLNSRIHWEERMCKDPKRAADYCKKGEQTKDEWHSLGCKGPHFGLNAVFEERGVISKVQGERTDIHNLMNKIISREITDTADIARTNPVMYMKYYKAIEKVDNQAIQLITRESLGITTIGEWYYGETGVGKSEYVFNRAKELGESVYEYADDGVWQDEYKGQDCYIIDEFRADMYLYRELLKMIDKRNFKLRRRNIPSRPFICKRVMITSSQSPWQCYNKLAAEDKIGQLIRRLKIFTRSHFSEPWVQIFEDPDDIQKKPYDENNLPIIQPSAVKNPYRKRF